MRRRSAPRAQAATHPATDNGDADKARDAEPDGDVEPEPDGDADAEPDGDVEPEPAIPARKANSRTVANRAVAMIRTAAGRNAANPDASPSGPQGSSEMSATEAAALARVKNLEPKERTYSYIAAAAGAALFCLVLIPILHKPVPNGQLLPQDFLALGLVMATVLAGATFIGRRSLVAFSALFLSFMATSLGGLLLGLPFLALAAWLLIRSWRFNKELMAARAAASAPIRTARTPNGRGRTSASPSRGTGDRRSSSSQARAQPETASEKRAPRQGIFSRLLGREAHQPELTMRPPPPPPPSRRYTPPKSAVKPSRKGRDGR